MIKLIMARFWEAILLDLLLAKSLMPERECDDRTQQSRERQ